MTLEAHFITRICRTTHDVDLITADWYRGEGIYGFVREADRETVGYGPFENVQIAINFMTTADGRRPNLHDSVKCG